MKLSKDSKPYYITVVSHFQMPSNTVDAEAWMTEQFATFDKKVNDKVEEGYVPYESFTMDHCDVASMDLVQAMVLKEQ